MVTATCIKSCSVTSVRYKLILQNYVISKLKQRSIVNDIVWMQKSTPLHVGQWVLPVLQQYFVDWAISLHFVVSWSPQVLDLTPMNFWFWGYLKSNMYVKLCKSFLLCYIWRCCLQSPASNSLSIAIADILKEFFPFLFCVLINSL